MLRFLRVRDLAVFKEAACDLGPGLNLITGETGAGKSLLVDAIGLLVGGRASLEAIRTGEERATVEGVFDLTPELRARLEDLGFDASGEELVVRRQINSGGRSRAFLNDSPATVETLRSLGEALVEIHGQHTHQALLRSEVHREWLDGVAGLEALREEVAGLCGDLAEAERGLEALLGGAEDRARRLEALEFQVAEIEAVGPRPGEGTALRSEAALLGNRERIVALAGEALFHLQEGEGAAARRAGRAAEALDEILQLTGEGTLAEAGGQAREASVLLGEAGQAVASFREALEADPGRLEAVEERLARIERLEKRYGGSLEAALAFLEEARNERDALRGQEVGTGDREMEVRALRDRYAAAALRLREARRRAAPGLEGSVEKELAALAMPGSRFVVRIEPVLREGTGVLVEGEEVRPHSHGTDRVEFLISPNPGEEPRPLARVASGGELSRIMLALRTCAPRSEDGTVTLVFDEVDAGVAGASADRVGRRLGAVADRHQVLCVTHLPQVAARAARHLAVTKKRRARRTVVEVRPVEGEERLAEVARMLGGTPAAREHARKLLGDKQKKKRARRTSRRAGATP